MIFGQRLNDLAEQADAALGVMALGLTPAQEGRLLLWAVVMVLAGALLVAWKALRWRHATTAVLLMGLLAGSCSAVALHALEREQQEIRAVQAR